MKFIFLTLVLLAIAACLLIFAAHGNRLSSEAAYALHAPEKVVLYSLEPESRRNTNDITLHGFKVLKQGRLGVNRLRWQALLLSQQFLKARMVCKRIALIRATHFGSWSRIKPMTICFVTNVVRLAFIAGIF